MHNRVILITLIALLIGACNQTTAPEVGDLNTTKKPRNVHAQELKISISRDEYAASARNVDLLRKLRLVEIVAPEELGRGLYPEYRLFNIAPGSSYALLGLKDGDVLVSANDYAISEPERFKRYVQVIHREQGETFIEIRRDGQEYLLVFQFS